MNDNRDPLTVLNSDDLPVAPDPAFAARLRARLQAAASLPRRTGGVVMSGTDTMIAELAEAAAPPVEPRSAVIAYLTVTDARAAITWYADAFGAALTGDPVEMDDGRIGHAELSLGGGILYLADEFPEVSLKAPSPQHVSVSLMLAVSDTDAALRRAREAGATIQREPYEAHGARGAALVDPFGHRWMLTGPVTGAAVPIQHGDVGYVALCTPDPERAAAFYAHVLGWTYDSRTRTVTGIGQRIRLTSGPNTLVCGYAVTDQNGAQQSILGAGGQVGEVERLDFGDVVSATDPQGLPFAVFEPSSEQPRPKLNGSGPGELSYITYQVPNSAVFKAFYGGLLFWTFEPGRVDDGWQVMGTHPMAGVAGGTAEPVVVPMWTVEDVDAAVARVREAGGTVIEEPSQQSYGKSALCTDDQGTRFYLGEF
ncbi:glyoxalase [Mycolicibacterium duvalii]|uniref:Glyoxalase n=1 Tax=Mycolicibacterium duvalii TaxID=39688 RepID=A0A7I7K3B4_9MYCO|nr:VOC family protein [Mycolicibacterium duvalii]MCV7367844.1 VOC family protein [Mycolicibacterium duvalii]PEG42527.1 glyoxalase [Mycolicibacterium duvalii]BBX18565.1 glyoxalase [Mycolicibacterium duvalii]